MSNSDVRQAPERKWLRVSVKTHAAVSSMQKILEGRTGYKPTHNELVSKGMEALAEKMEAGR